MPAGKTRTKRAAARKVPAVFNPSGLADFSAKKLGRGSSTKLFETDFARLCGKRNWLMTSGEVEIFKSLKKGLLFLK